MKYTNSNQWYQEYGKEVMDKNEFSEFEKYLNDRRQNGSHTLDEWENLYDDFLKDSKKSARKSIKESSVGYYIYSKPLGDKYAYCDKSKFTEEGFYLIEDYMLDAIHIFETEKEAQKFIDKYAKHFMVDEDNIIIAEYPSNKLGFFESKKSVRKSLKESIKEANESVIIDGKKTNFEINDYGTFFGEKIKYMLIGEPLKNEDVLVDFLEENSNFEFKKYKIPYSTVYYIYNDEKSLFGVAYRHYIRLTNDEKDAKIMLAYATDKRDLYNGL